MKKENEPLWENLLYIKNVCLSNDLVDYFVAIDFKYRLLYRDIIHETHNIGGF